MSNNKVVILDENFQPYDDSNPLPILITNIDEITGGGGITVTGTPVNNQLTIWTSSTSVEGTPDITYDSATRYLTYTALTDDNSLLIQPSTTAGLVNSPYFAMRTFSTGAPLDFNFHATRTGTTTYTFEITDTNGDPVSTWTNTGNLDVPGAITGSRFISDVAVGTAPLTVTSSTVVSSLNSDLWDGYQFSDYLDQAVKAASSPTFVRIKGESKLCPVTIVNPAGFYAVDTQLPFLYTDAAITVTRVVVSTNTASYEVAGDVKWADNLTSFTNATVINAFDTTSGVLDDSSITAGSVASGKWLYLQLDSAPNAAVTFMTVQVFWDYD